MLLEWRVELKSLDVCRMCTKLRRSLVLTGTSLELIFNSYSPNDVDLPDGRSAGQRLFPNCP